MSFDTRAEYYYRINKVIDYIHGHSEEELTLEKCSKVSCFSLYHFHRIFHAIIGEPFSSYLRRVRLEQAAYLLKYTKSRSITDIAFSLGFGSSTAFSRAFKHHFACTPGQIRKGFLGDVKKKSEEFLKANKPDGITGFKIERLNEIRVFVRRYVGTYQNFAVQKEWCLHIKDAKSRGYITPKSRYFGIMYNDPECSDEGRCRYDCCISVETAIKEKVKVIPAGQYALFTVVATIADDPFELFQWIYGTWLPASGYEVCDTESYNDYYSFSVEEDTGKFHEQIQYRICLPVVKYVKSSRNMSNRR